MWDLKIRFPKDVAEVPGVNNSGRKHRPVIKECEKLGLVSTPLERASRGKWLYGISDPICLHARRTALCAALYLLKSKLTRA